jgi:hypothetical protein
MGSGVSALQDLDLDGAARKTAYKSDRRHVYSVIVSSSGSAAAEWGWMRCALAWRT